MSYTPCICGADLSMVPVDRHGPSRAIASVLEQGTSAEPKTFASRQ